MPDPLSLFAIIVTPLIVGGVVGWSTWRTLGYHKLTPGRKQKWEAMLREGTGEAVEEKEPEKKESGDWLPPNILSIDKQSAVVLIDNKPRPVYSDRPPSSPDYHEFWKLADTNRYLSVCAPMVNSQLQQALSVKFKPDHPASKAILMMKDHR